LKLVFSRHPSLAVRKPEAALIQRTIGFNIAKVSQFFDVLEKECLNESGERIIFYTNIYNVDESGFTCVQKPQKSVAKL